MTPTALSSRNQLTFPAVAAVFANFREDDWYAVNLRELIERQVLPDGRPLDPLITSDQCLVVIEHLTDTELVQLAERAVDAKQAKRTELALTAIVGTLERLIVLCENDVVSGQTARFGGGGITEAVAAGAAANVLTSVAASAFRAVWEARAATHDPLKAHLAEMEALRNATNPAKRPDR